jgi:undecaprenyl-diphosphatase
MPERAPAVGDLPMARMWRSIERMAVDLWVEVTARLRSAQASQAARAVASSGPWPDWVGAVITFALSEVALALLMLSIAAHYVSTFPFDPGLEAQIQRLNGTFLAQPIRLAGDLQWYQPAAISYVSIYAMLLILRRYRAFICTAISVFGADLFDVVVNTLVARPRPYGVRIPTLIDHLGQGPFPSGPVAHTIGLYGFVFFLCVLATRAAPRWKRVLIAVQAICVYFILFVGLARIMVGARWPSDVLSGYLSGSLVLLLAIVLYHLLAMRAVRVKVATAVARPALVCHLHFSAAMLGLPLTRLRGLRPRRVQWTISRHRSSTL